MKKYALILFFILCWSVTALFRSPPEIIPVVGFAAALACLLFIKNEVVSFIVAAVLCVGMSVYDIGFLHAVPALLLVPVRSMASVDVSGKKKKKSDRRDVVFTLLLLTMLFSVGLLVFDIRTYVFMKNMFTLERTYWLLLGITSFFLALILTARRSDNKKAHKLTLAVYMCGGVSALFSSVGFMFTSFYAEPDYVAFPWLCFLAVSAAADDSVISAFRAAVGRIMKSEV